MFKFLIFFSFCVFKTTAQILFLFNFDAIDCNTNGVAMTLNTRLFVVIKIWQISGTFFARKFASSRSCQIANYVLVTTNAPAHIGPFIHCNI